MDINLSSTSKEALERLCLYCKDEIVEHQRHVGDKWETTIVIYCNLYGEDGKKIRICKEIAIDQNKDESARGCYDQLIFRMYSFVRAEWYKGLQKIIENSTA